MSLDEGVWKQLDPRNVSVYPNAMLAHTCEACGDTYLPIRSSDQRDLCDPCFGNFKKFCKAQKKLKLLDHE